MTLWMSQYGTPTAMSWLDALFTATSATCVTGLSVIEVGQFDLTGQIIVLSLIQLGGLGIMTFGALLALFLYHQVPLTERLAVAESLLPDQTLKLGAFLLKLAGTTFCLELFGATVLYLYAPRDFPPFSAVFHAVSAFCNAGFSLHATSLTAWRADLVINVVFMGLIILGGLGFTVLLELSTRFRPRARLSPLSWYTKMVLSTTLVLILSGWMFLYYAEYLFAGLPLDPGEALLATLFQSVSCRTAGFNTLNIGTMTNLSLLIMLLLMLVGGGSGSCAGGLKLSTVRVLFGQLSAQVRGSDQCLVEGKAIDQATQQRALLLFTFSIGILFAAVVLLNLSEGIPLQPQQARGQFAELLFEAVSAFCTVGLSTGTTPTLGPMGKLVIIMLMYVGRLGPLAILVSLRRLQPKQRYRYPERGMMVG